MILFIVWHQYRGQLTYIGYSFMFDISTSSCALFSWNVFIAFILLCDSFTKVTRPLTQNE